MLCIIPARGGSKRIPRKNIRLFHGVPIISRVIKTALKANVFSHIIVSTDDSEIKQIALDAGASVPFIRGTELSDDFTGISDVVIDALARSHELIRDIDTVCCLLPTAVLLTPDDLSTAMTTASTMHSGQFLFSAGEFRSPIQRSIVLNNSGLTKMNFPEHYNSRSQDLRPSYYDAGQFYVADRQTWLNNHSIFEGSLISILPFARSVDIDTMEDWILAESLFSLQ